MVIIGVISMMSFLRGDSFAGNFGGRSSSKGGTTTETSTLFSSLGSLCFLAFLLMVVTGRHSETKLWNVNNPAKGGGVADRNVMMRDSRVVNVRHARVFVPPAVDKAREVMQREGHICMPLVSVGVPLCVVTTKTTTMINPRLLQGIGPVQSKKFIATTMLGEKENKEAVVSMNVHAGVLVEFTRGDLWVQRQEQTFYGVEAECIQVAMKQFNAKEWNELVRNQQQDDVATATTTTAMQLVGTTMLSRFASSVMHMMFL